MMTHDGWKDCHDVSRQRIYLSIYQQQPMLSKVDGEDEISFSRTTRDHNKADLAIAPAQLDERTPRRRRRKQPALKRYSWYSMACRVSNRQ
jgi:hypothetical protein